MKLINNKRNEYASPEARLIDVMLEGLLCTSTFESDETQLEGYGNQNSFTGWGN